MPSEGKLSVFAEQIEALARGGADAVILETFTDLEELLIGLRAARQACKLPVLAQMTFTEQFKTPRGVGVAAMVSALEGAGADVIGVNCGVGPHATLDVVQAIGRLTKAPISVFPNAGLPEFVDGRYMYLSTPDYFARMARRMVLAGANLVGGCCGTTPAEIRAIAERLHGIKPSPRRVRPAAEVLPPEPKIEPAAPARPTTFLDRLAQEKVIVVEIDPPRGLSFDKLLKTARKLVDAGVRAITVGDNPLAVMRMGHIGFAHLLEREGIETVLHLSCRDRNVIGLQSAILEAWALGIRTVLAITGDPAKVGDQPGASSVYDLNSFELIKLLGAMNEGKSYVGASIQKRTDFKIGGAFNPNVKDLELQIRRLKKKVDLGIHFALPQPLYDRAKVKPMYARLREVVGGLPVFFGVCPFVSSRNAEFLAHEVPGITVPEDVLHRIRETPEAKQREEGLKISCELIEEAYDDAPGFYLIPPFANAEIALEIVRAIRACGKARRSTP